MQSFLHCHFWSQLFVTVSFLHFLITIFSAVSHHHFSLQFLCGIIFVNNYFLLCPCCCFAIAYLLLLPFGFFCYFMSLSLFLVCMLSRTFQTFRTQPSFALAIQRSSSHKVYVLPYFPCTHFSQSIPCIWVLDLYCLLPSSSLFLYYFASQFRWHNFTTCKSQLCPQLILTIYFDPTLLF